MAFKKNDATPKITVAANQDQQDLHDAAVKSVLSQHGPYARRNPNYDELVEDAKRQISKAIEDNKTF